MYSMSQLEHSSTSQGIQKFELSPRFDCNKKEKHVLQMLQNLNVKGATFSFILTFQ